jgi:hypothetical protein
MTRTGLAAHVPTLDLCREMAAIPALAEAFKNTPLTWWMLTQSEWGIVPRALMGNNIPAPLCDEMLAWLDLQGYIVQDSAIHVGTEYHAVYGITDPDALARACLEAAK